LKKAHSKTLQDFGGEDTNWVGNTTDLIRHRRGLESWEEARKVDWWTDVECMDSYVFYFSLATQQALIFPFILRMLKITTKLLTVRSSAIQDTK